MNLLIKLLLLRWSIFIYYYYFFNIFWPILLYWVSFALCLKTWLVNLILTCISLNIGFCILAQVVRFCCLNFSPIKNYTDFRWEICQKNNHYGYANHIYTNYMFIEVLYKCNSHGPTLAFFIIKLHVNFLLYKFY